jgi:hypothetical protein
MKKISKLAILAASKGATGKLPSYMKKFVPKNYIRSNTVNVSAAEEILLKKSSDVKKRKTKSR